MDRQNLNAQNLQQIPFTVGDIQANLTRDGLVHWRDEGDTRTSAVEDFFASGPVLKYVRGNLLTITLLPAIFGIGEGLMWSGRAVDIGKALLGCLGSGAIPASQAEGQPGQQHEQTTRGSPAAAR